MDRFTHDRLQNDAILRAQHRAGLRKPSHTRPGDPRRHANPRNAAVHGLEATIRAATGSGGN
jgi:hypothetical protein